MQPDLSEMRCRHCHAAWGMPWEYCPQCLRNYGGAIYPEKQTAEEIDDITRLIDVIAAAFHGVRLDDGETIHEADLEGADLDDSVRVSAREKDLEVNWQEVPDWKLERFHSALNFFDVKGWRFYLPADMIWTLKNWRTVYSVTPDWTIETFDAAGGSYYRARYATLSQKQSEAVFQFLNYSNEPAPRTAIQQYWYLFAQTDTDRL